MGVAVNVSRLHSEFKRIVTMVNDAGQRYFSTELCGKPKEVEIPEREHIKESYAISELDKYQNRWK